MAFVTPLTKTFTAKHSSFVSPATSPVHPRDHHVSFAQRPVPAVMPTLAPTICMSVNAPTAFKDALLEKIAPLDFGRTIADNPREQGEIEELARQVEATNRSTNPSADPNLSARWLCKYTTSNSILRVNLPPFLQPVEIIQYINAANLTAKNVEVFKIGPFKFTNAVEAKLIPKSNSLFDVNFIQFILFGTFKFNVEKNENFKGFLDITYLDDDTRISRGNKGNLFVLVKDKSEDYP